MDYDIPRDWINLNTLTGIALGSSVYVHNVGFDEDRLEIAIQATEPDVTYRGYPISAQQQHLISPPNNTDPIWIRYNRYGYDSQKTRKRICKAKISEIPFANDTTAFPSDFVSSAPVGDRRLSVETLTLAQRYIIDGIGYTTEWIEQVANGASAYAEFVVPSGFYMALDYRELNTQKESIFYYVFPGGTYTAGAPLSNTGEIVNGSLRTDAPNPFTPLTRLDPATTVKPADSERVLRVPAYGVPSGGSGVKATGALSSDSIFRLLQPDSRFLLELRNDGAGPSNIQLNLVYAFIPEANVYPPQV